MPTLLTLTTLAAAFIALNLLAFAMFWIDKAKARVGAWRVAESTLLMLAFVGGTLGAYAGRAVFRHKTHKQPFNSNLFAIAVVQGAGAGRADWVVDYGLARAIPAGRAARFPTAAQSAIKLIVSQRSARTLWFCGCCV